jgi:hypothetical protein
MGIVFLVFAAGLLFAKFRTQERGLQVFLFRCAALNLAAFANAYVSNSPYLWRLMENPCNEDSDLPECKEPAYRR